MGDYLKFSDLQNKVITQFRESITPTDGSPIPPFGFDVMLPIAKKKVDEKYRWQRFEAKLAAYAVVVETNSLFTPSPVFTGLSEVDKSPFLAWVIPHDPVKVPMLQMRTLKGNEGIVLQLTDLHDKPHGVRIRCSTYNDINSTIKDLLQAIGKDAGNFANGVIQLNPVGGQMSNTTVAARGAIDQLLQGLPDAIADKPTAEKNVVLVEPTKIWWSPGPETAWVGYKLLSFDRDVEETITIENGGKKTKQNIDIVKYSTLSMWRLTLSTTSDYAALPYRPFPGGSAGTSVG